MTHDGIFRYANLRSKDSRVDVDSWRRGRLRDDDEISFDLSVILAKNTHQSLEQRE